MYETFAKAIDEATALAKENPWEYYCVIRKDDGLYYISSPEDAWQSIVFGLGWDLGWQIVYECRLLKEGATEFLSKTKATKARSNILNDCLQVELFSDATRSSDISAETLTFAGFEGAWAAPNAPAIKPERIMEIIRDGARVLGVKFTERLQAIPFEKIDYAGRATTCLLRSYFAAYMLENGLQEISIDRAKAREIGEEIVGDETYPEYDVMETTKGDRIILKLISNERRSKWRLQLPS